MIINVSKSFLVTLGAIALVALGAGGMYEINKLSTPPITAPTNVTPPVAAATAPQAAPQPTPATTQTTATTTTTAPPVAEAQTVVSPIQVARPVAHPGYALAQIINVRPYYVTKSYPYTTCHPEPRAAYSSPAGPSGAGAILGGVTGGLVGHQIGNGNGNVAATIGGTILGAVVGNQVETGMSQPQPHVFYERVCTTEYEHRTIRKGYKVTYLYEGEKNTIIVEHSPTQEFIEIPATEIE